MKKLIYILLLLFPVVKSNAQEIAQMQETAKTYMKQGDYTNAALLLEKAVKADPENLEISKDLAVSYLVLRKNTKALETLLPFVQNGKADDQTYQLVGNTYNVLDQRKESEATYKRGIKKFPASGALYSEYGEMLLSRQDVNAIKIWEKGIENDPQYPGNYFNATRFYTINTNRIWAALYGEIFILLESSTNRTAEIKNGLFEDYKKMLTDEELSAEQKGKSGFEKALVQIINKEKKGLPKVLNTESLTMLRTRIVLDWVSLYAKKYPFSLFQIHEAMLSEGIFEAYNEWLFGPVQNLAAYQNWINTHQDEYQAFTNYQKGRLFKFSKVLYNH